MSAFSVPIKRIRAIEPHLNADALDFAVIDGYRSIVKKGEFRVGDLVAYIPEASVLPEWLLKWLNFWDDEKGCGRLNGKAGNRVKAIKLRGSLSQGLLYPTEKTASFADDVVPFSLISKPLSPIVVGKACLEVQEGDDVAEFLGITKYEPPIPVALSGEVLSAGPEFTVNFDVENWKSYPDIIQEGEAVIFTEKLHGTFTGVSVLPLKDAHPEAFGANKNILIYSKGLGAKGLVLKNNERNANNVYVRATRGLVAAIDALLSGTPGGVERPQHFLGESFGPGVQDLAYGETLGFRLFAVAHGYRGAQSYGDWDDVERVAEAFGVATVPVLYRGPFSEAAMREHTDGKTTLGAGHIREGIVMVPERERHDPAIGRVCLKSVSADYLTRKGGTEFN